MFKKKGKYAGIDADHDKIDDDFEINVLKTHDAQNHPRHFMIGEYLPKPQGVVISIHHQTLKSSVNYENHHGICLTMKEPKKMSLSLKLDSPNLDGIDFSKIKTPSGELDDSKIRYYKKKFSEDRINEKINAILKKKKVKI
jgi:hypothetical protein